MYFCVVECIFSPTIAFIQYIDRDGNKYLALDCFHSQIII